MATAEVVLPIITDISPALMSGNCTPAELQDEAFLTEQITYLWTVRECHATTIAKDRKGMRSVDSNLGQLFYNLKAVLARPGRAGKWSAWLKEKGIARATADRLVTRFARSCNLIEKSPHEQIEPTELEIGRLFGAIWPRIEKTLTTQQSFYDFLCCLIGRSGLQHEYRPSGIFVFDAAHVATPQEPETVSPSPETRTGSENPDDLYGAVL